MRLHSRFVTVVCLLASVGLLLNTRHHETALTVHSHIAELPRTFDDWVGTDVSIQPSVLTLLGDAEFLDRRYRRGQADTSSVEVFIAYFPSQRFGDTFHSPKNCLPGSGWMPVDSHQTELKFQGHPPVLVNRYLVSKGDQRALVLYWYQIHGRSVASEYWARFYLVEDSIRFNYSDGSLIRISTALAEHETEAAAQGRLLDLIYRFLPVAEDYLSG